MTLAISGDQEALEECIEALDETLMNLERHRSQVVAEAIATHLEALLRAMLAEAECTADDVRDFLGAIENGALN